MATPLTLNTDRTSDGVPRVVVAGEIDMTNVAVFADALTEAAESADRGGAVAVDLAAVKYLDSAAINALFAQTDRVARMHLVVHPFLMPVLRISGLGELATIEPAS
ncbi:STAS domain-containing protein [Mycolicibacterium arenosum]|uniref:STAS domain-containing protein n=1 Tax=Mycolicibacterium arenosum TaxID=2952157 RepID=A0ABT1LUX3_9MYCO|nr:STAS domain-containing protein [Mycolicibacterium sp. CAU 1645]MCP9270703.1 STAS domain-containing protein [Mycolicibacterium sp. CAU 1645]